jgi:hypothetical protein
MFPSRLDWTPEPIAAPGDSATALRGSDGTFVAEYHAPVKGDRVEVVIDAGAGLERYEIVASKAGRRVEVATARGGQVEVSEVTRNGQPVRTARFMASRVVALVEHPAEEPDDEAARPTRGRRVDESQQSLI